jgi:raffinose/stachyose/melibiose transport system permease protein
MQVHDMQGEEKTAETKNRTRALLLKILLNGFLMLYAATAIFPPIWMFYSSIKTQAEFAVNVFSLPTHVYFTNYIKIFGMGTIYRATFNSLFASLVSIILIVMLSFAVGYVLARYHFRLKRPIYLFFLFGILVPVYGLLVPVFIQFKAIGMLDNQFTIIPPMVAFGMPISIFLIEGYVNSIPISLEESAYMDGSSQLNSIARIIFPICSPIVATIVILSFLSTWNEFGFPLVLLRSPQLKTVPLWLRTFFGQYATDYTGLMAALMIASIPVIIAYLIFHEKIMQGLTAGAVKG